MSLNHSVSLVSAVELHGVDTITVSVSASDQLLDMMLRLPCSAKIEISIEMKLIMSSVLTVASYLATNLDVISSSPTSPSCACPSQHNPASHHP